MRHDGDLIACLSVIKHPIIDRKSSVILVHSLNLIVDVLDEQCRRATSIATDYVKLNPSVTKSRSANQTDWKCKLIYNL
jgi:hypothetical protein